MFQGDGEDEEPAEWQHVAMGTWKVHEQALRHSGETGLTLYPHKVPRVLLRSFFGTIAGTWEPI